MDSFLASTGESIRRPAEEAAVKLFRELLARAGAVLLVLVAMGLWAPRSAHAAGGAAASAPVAAPVDAPELPPGISVGPVPEGFHHYDGGWLQLSYPPSVWPRVQKLIGVAEQAKRELQTEFGTEVLRSVTVRVARTIGEMPNLAPKGAPYPSYASGVAYSQVGLVLLAIYPQQPTDVHNLEEILRHELAHVALFDAVKGRNVPRWFNEGLAIYLSGERSYLRTKTLWVSTLAGNLLPLSTLDTNFPNHLVETPLAYAQSADVVRYLMRAHGGARFAELTRRIASGQTFDSALDDVYAVDIQTLEYDWRQEVAKRYSFWPLFFSGSMVWVGAMGLFFFGWMRKRRSQAETLQRWAKEEALEETRALALRAPAESRVHIMLGPAKDTDMLVGMPPPAELRGREKDVPKVQHDGSWHTLH